MPIDERNTVIEKAAETHRASVGVDKLSSVQLDPIELSILACRKVAVVILALDVNKPAKLSRYQHTVRQSYALAYNVTFIFVVAVQFLRLDLRFLDALRFWNIHAFGFGRRTTH
jgi:hypothetical protein